MAAKTDVAGRRVKKAGEPALASYADKDITPVMTEYIQWLTEQTGYEVDPLSVQLSGVLRGRFQKSDVNQARLAARAEEIEQEKLDRIKRAEDRVASKEQKAAARAAKAAEPKAEKPAPATKTAKAKAAPAAKAAPVKKAASAKAAAKPAPVARRRPAASAKGGAQADF
jgi:hypothetical protein